MEKIFKFFKCFTCAKEFLSEKDYNKHVNMCGKLKQKVNICYYFYDEENNSENVDFEQKLGNLKNEIELVRVPFTIDHVAISVNRDNVLNDSIEQLLLLENNDLHKEFQLNFIGEISNDAGGLTKEWLSLLIQNFFNDKFFIKANSSNKSYILPCFSPKNYYIFGLVIGKAIFENIPVNCPLNKIIFKYLVNEKIKKKDFQLVDEDFFNSLIQIKENNIEGIYIGNFTITKEINNQKLSYDLIPDGSQVSITEENKHDYIRKCINFELKDSIKASIEEMKEGFYHCITPHMIKNFTSEDLEKVLCGNSNIDINEWKDYTEYKDSYSENHPTIKNFWKALEKFSQESLRNLLQFVTSYSTMPIEGFKNLQNNRGEICRFTIVPVKYSPGALPKGHTCFNRLDLPVYLNFEELKKSLEFITSHSFDFQID